MDVEQCRNELMTQGLSSYPDAKRAVATFVKLAGEIAGKVIVDNLDKVKEVTENNTLKETDLSIGTIGPDQSITRVGVKMEAPGTWGIYLGIKWTQQGELHPEIPQAFLSVVLNIRTRRDTLLKNLRNNAEEETVRIEDFVGQYWEVHVTFRLPAQGSIEQVQEGLKTVLTAFLKMVQKCGTLRTAIDEQPK